MAIVTISSNNYASYVDLPTAKIYLAARVGPGPDAWNASSDDNAKGRALVSAKLYLDEQTWQGLKTVSSQSDEWPRTGVSDKYGTAIDSATVPQQVINAQCELAAIFMSAPAVDAAVNAGSNVKTVSAARGVDVEFFHPTDLGSLSTKLPVIVQRLVGQFLAAGKIPSVNTAYNSRDPDSGAYGFDDCVSSSFDGCAEYTRKGPFG